MDTPTADSQALPQGARLEEFVIERVLGAGGFGITYLARDTSLGRQVVIKENLPSQFAWRETTTGTVRPRHTTGGDLDDYEWSMSNFLRESGTLASLDHPGIVRVLRQFSANGTAYFVMPFVEGVPLDSLIEERSAKNKPFTQEELLGLTTRMLDALGYIHQCNLYHRDIKPANILISMDGIPVLIDFGSARQSIGERSMTVIESAGYTPFEQLQSRGNIGPWSDLYAFGATLAKAITFETPPKAADRMMGDPWPGLVGDSRCASFSDWFLQAIDRSMAVDPSQRWQNAAEWREFLNGGASSTAASVHQYAPPPVPPHLPKQPTAAAPVYATQSSNPSASTLVLGCRQPAAPAYADQPSNPYQPPAHIENPAAPAMKSFQQYAPTITGDQVRPWVRLWARTIDVFLFAIIAGFIFGIVAPGILVMPELALGIMFTFGYNFVEPAMLSAWGTTPGKALLRVAVRKSDGSKLNYSEGLNRVFKVWLRGMGLGIPIAALFTHLTAYNKLTKSGITSWDQEGGIQVIHQKIGFLRVLATLGIFFVFLVFMAAGNAA
jgi:serine/threonine protein kinase